ncbi:MAG: hypothetical protein AB1814_04000 [Thermodesulfobacteriota bacterium]
MSSKKDTPPPRLSPQDEAVLKAAKEIAVKFIETGRLSLAAFDEAFPQIYRTIHDAVHKEKK